MPDAPPTTVAAIDWQTWTPVDRATLLFVIREDRILLIHKKRGLGAGKIIGPGGRLEDGETPQQAAIREIHEEIGVEPGEVEPVGELRFQFVDGYSIHVWVFKANDFAGDPIETEEAIPLWYSLDSIPYDEMWADNRVWIPVMLRGESFSGQFIFDGDRILDHTLDIVAD